MIGVPHDVLGEDLAAVVVPAPGARRSTPTSYGATASRRSPPTRSPGAGSSSTQLPRNPAGKVLKHELQSGFADTSPVVEPTT